MRRVNALLAAAGIGAAVLWGGCGAAAKPAPEEHQAVTYGEIRDRVDSATDGLNKATEDVEPQTNTR